MTDYVVLLFRLIPFLAAGYYLPIFALGMCLCAFRLTWYLVLGGSKND